MSIATALWTPVSPQDLPERVAGLLPDFIDSLVKSPASFVQCRVRAGQFLPQDAYSMLAHLDAASFSSAMWLCHDGYRGALLTLGFPTLFTKRCPEPGKKGDVLLLDWEAVFLGPRYADLVTLADGETLIAQVVVLV